MFHILIAHDVADGASLRAATKLVHKAYLDAPAAGVEVLISGPMLDDAGGEIGSVIVFRADDAAQLRAFLAEEPYQRAGLFAQTELRLEVGAWQPLPLGGPARSWTAQHASLRDL